MEKNIPKLTNEGLLLLYSICERKKNADYEIDPFVKELFYQTGTDVRPADPVTLNKLIKQQLIRPSSLPGQGRNVPAGDLEVTSAGKQLLLQEIVAALASARERDCRFDVALAASGLVQTEKAIAALEERKRHLSKVVATVQALFATQARNEQPPHLKALCKHLLSLIQCEIEFMDVLIQALAGLADGYHA